MVRWYTHISEQSQFKAACQMENQNPELLDCLGLPRREASVVHDQSALSRLPAAEPAYRI
jgi:hypothetical protein